MRVTARGDSRKKATNVSLSIDLLEEAKELNINLSATFDRALAEAINTRKRQQWLNENREAISACNLFMEKAGLFSDEFTVL